jgi:hypothetical protein
MADPEVEYPSLLKFTTSLRYHFSAVKKSKCDASSMNLLLVKSSKPYECRSEFHMTKNLVNFSTLKKSINLMWKRVEVKYYCSIEFLLLLLLLICIHFVSKKSAPMNDAKQRKINLNANYISDDDLFVNEFNLI